MQRSLMDDVKWAVCVLIGVTAGYVVLGADDPGLLVGSLAGVLFVIIVAAILRRFVHRRST